MQGWILVFVALVHTNKLVITAPVLDEIEAEGYYWRDFSSADEIPTDALPGGKNSNGKTTYIAQILYEDTLVPAKIDAEEKKVYFAWKDLQELTANKLNCIKILCAQHSEQFKWIPTNSSTMNNVKDLFLGGHMSLANIYIGRKQLENELSVGKIISKNDFGISHLYTTKDGKCTAHSEFEVLTYNSKAKISKNSEKSGSTSRISFNTVDNFPRVFVKTFGQFNETGYDWKQYKGVFINIYNYAPPDETKV